MKQEKASGGLRRFFRRYLVTGVGILLLFILANVLMLGTLSSVIYGRMSDGADAPVDALAACVSGKAGDYTVDEPAFAALAGENGGDLPWAMLLDADGMVAWSWRAPAEVLHPYTAAEIANFSRWYLADYPVVVRVMDGGGLLVLAFDKNRVARIGLSNLYTFQSLQAMLVGGAAVFAINLLLAVGLFWYSLRRMERGVAPLVAGVERLAQGQPAHLPETGDFAPAHAALNRASAQLARRDAARAEWIGGISHDVRTPLAVILGYAATLEDDPALPAAARTQAGAIRAQAERLRTLMEDLNLTSKLEYSMQPLRLRYLDPAELARGVVTDFLNAGLSEGFTLDFSAEGPADTMEGDPALLARALENLIRNSIRHNPGGCAITVAVARGADGCRFTVADDGVGMPAEARAKVQASDFGPLYGTAGGAAHGFGLRLVAGIVRVHGGKLELKEAVPTGLQVSFSIPRGAPRE